MPTIARGGYVGRRGRTGYSRSVVLKTAKAFGLSTGFPGKKVGLDRYGKRCPGSASAACCGPVDCSRSARFSSTRAEICCQRTAPGISLIQARFGSSWAFPKYYPLKRGKASSLSIRSNKRRCLHQYVAPSQAGCLRHVQVVERSWA